jgi:hypothetical protein
MTVGQMRPLAPAARFGFPIFCTPYTSAKYNENVWLDVEARIIKAANRT